jgi:uncharacterized protein
MAGRLFSPRTAGLAVAIRVTPRASRTCIDGIATDADGGQALKIAVNAPPEDGKANEAVIKLLAKEWRLPKNTLTIATGATARRKTIVIAGDVRALETRITDWLRQNDCV